MYINYVEHKNNKIKNVLNNSPIYFKSSCKDLSGYVPLIVRIPKDPYRFTNICSNFDTVSIPYFMLKKGLPHPTFNASESLKSYVTDEKVII